MGNGKVGRIENERRRKYSKMDKKAKDKLVRSPGENGGGQDVQKDLHSRVHKYVCQELLEGKFLFSCT